MAMDLKTIFPIKRKKSFIRDEGGYCIAIGVNKGMDDIVSIEGIGPEIIELCTGENSIEKIVNIISTKYTGVSKEEIEQDIVGYLNELYVNEIIMLKGGKIEMNLGKVVNEQGKYSIFRCSENEIKDIFNFISNKENEKLMMKELLPVEYNILNLRAKLFSFNEEYYFLQEDGKNIGLISFNTKVKTQTKRIYGIGVMMASKELNEEVLLWYIQASMKDLKSIPASNVSKVRADFIKLEDVDLAKILKKIDFKEVGFMKDEYGDGVDRHIYDYAI